MAMNFAPWKRATRCVGGARPGAKALMAWLVANYRPPGAAGGIYVCRRITGSTSYSVHSEGRAIDWFMPMTGGRGSAAGTALVNRLGNKGKALGIQCIIYNRRIYTASAPNGKYYSGAHPHYDHLHIELTPTAGSYLTLTTIKNALAGAVKPPSPTPSTTNPVLREGMGGAAVGRAQTRLNLHGAKLVVDNSFGPATKAAVIAFQKAKRLTVDGVIGNYTWAALYTAPSTAGTKMVVTASVLNVRSGPGTNYAIKGTLKKGTVVYVVSTSNGWSKLSTGYYVAAKYLARA